MKTPEHDAAIAALNRNLVHSAYLLGQQVGGINALRGDKALLKGTKNLDAQLDRQVTKVLDESPFSFDEDGRLVHADDAGDRPRPAQLAPSAELKKFRELIA